MYYSSRWFGQITVLFQFKFMYDIRLIWKGEAWLGKILIIDFSWKMKKGSNKLAQLFLSVIVYFSTDKYLDSIDRLRRKAKKLNNCSTYVLTSFFRQFQMNQSLSVFSNCVTDLKIETILKHSTFFHFLYFKCFQIFYHFSEWGDGRGIRFIYRKWSYWAKLESCPAMILVNTWHKSSLMRLKKISSDGFFSGINVKLWIIKTYVKYSLRNYPDRRGFCYYACIFSWF